MRIGLDFDNTLVCYDELFLRLGYERGVTLEADNAEGKMAIRDHLRSVGQEDVWTAMQGEAYGVRIGEATLYAGAPNFVREALAHGHEVFVVSHKTRQPFAGPPCDLHEAGRNFLRKAGLIGLGGIGEEAVFLEVTREEKLARIDSLKCDVFVDDLEELLLLPTFPKGVRRILFCPSGDKKHNDNLERARSWYEVARLLNVSVEGD